MHQKILICDNAVYSRAMLKNLINHIGDFIIVETENGTQLLDKIKDYKQKNKSFDIVLLGMELKNEDSFSVLSEIREIEPLLEVVLCGGLSLTDENISKGISFGVRSFLPKPYKLENLVTILDSNGVN